MHDMKDHGATMLFVDVNCRMVAAQSGCRVAKKDGKTWMPQQAIDAFAAKGFKPATMADARKAFIASESKRDEDGKPIPPSPEELKALTAAFDAQVER